MSAVRVESTLFLLFFFIIPFIIAVVLITVLIVALVRRSRRPDTSFTGTSAFTPPEPEPEPEPASEPADEPAPIETKSFPEILKSHRTARHMSQEYLAEQLGVTRQAVSKWESGTSEPSTANLLALAKLYGISLDELVGLK
ncbi:MAG: helix-turn-helix transcriptional regulator [Clostridia bacterium]|nr:helix-turn-helix transcriptional regulator [Clostridia bacterium]MBQ8333319.1 helix-turn-helix transcriptional regulator [Clostridia bacterium]MBQ8369007.1 helix-turn-helix transcriptional regulator [Clostridia bacterium]